MKSTALGAENIIFISDALLMNILPCRQKIRQEICQRSIK